MLALWNPTLHKCGWGYFERKTLMNATNVLGLFPKPLMICLQCWNGKNRIAFQTKVLNIHWISFPSLSTYYSLDPLFHQKLELHTLPLLLPSADVNEQLCTHRRTLLLSYDWSSHKNVAPSYCFTVELNCVHCKICIHGIDMPRVYCCNPSSFSALNHRRPCVLLRLAGGQ